MQKVSNTLNIPIKYTCAIENVAKRLPDDMEGQIISIRMIMREDWM